MVTSFAADPSELVKEMIDQQTEHFETLVLNCVINDGSFYAEVERLLCVDAKTGHFACDFTSDIDNAL